MSGVILSTVLFIGLVSLYFAFGQVLFDTWQEDPLPNDPTLMTVLGVIVGIGLLILVAVIVVASLIIHWLRSSFLMRAREMMKLTIHLILYSVQLLLVSLVIGCVIDNQLSFYTIIGCIAGPVVCIVSMLSFLTRGIHMIDPLIALMPYTAAQVSTGYPLAPQQAPLSYPMWPPQGYPPISH